ncbi:hypothetical protein [Streptomyces sp. DH37]|uniref:hypothetical protein n=1 Tax=Streptomyces sp. DH37 TaxID=3040122 RepID=UPI00244169AC|nr:hypothetical protein [Streptomyces sp. DH37]MDG9703825.1 hypothetical protein [Streptomyces sp. DH37]
MAYGEPNGPHTHQYEIWVRATEHAGEYPVSFTVRPDTADISAAEAEAVMQKFVDLIDSSPDFTLSSASRTYRYHQAITPTPPAS